MNAYRADFNQRGVLNPGRVAWAQDGYMEADNQAWLLFRVNSDNADANSQQIGRSQVSGALETELMHFCSVQTSKVINGTWRPYPPLPLPPSPASAQRPGQRQPPTTPSAGRAVVADTAAASAQSSQRPPPRTDMAQVSPAARPASGAQQRTATGGLMEQARAAADTRRQVRERAASARAKFSSRKPEEMQRPSPLPFEAESPQVKRLRRHVEPHAGDAASDRVRRELPSARAFAAEARAAAEEVLDVSQSPDSQRTDLPGSGDSLNHMLQSPPPASPAAASLPVSPSSSAPCDVIGADSHPGARARAVRTKQPRTSAAPGPAADDCDVDLTEESTAAPAVKRRCTADADKQQQIAIAMAGFVQSLADDDAQDDAEPAAEAVAEADSGAQSSELKRAEERKAAAIAGCLENFSQIWEPHPLREGAAGPSMSGEIDEASPQELEEEEEQALQPQAAPRSSSRRQTRARTFSRASRLFDSQAGEDSDADQEEEDMEEEDEEELAEDQHEEDKGFIKGSSESDSESAHSSQSEPAATSRRPAQTRGRRRRLQTSSEDSSS